MKCASVTAPEQRYTARAHEQCAGHGARAATHEQSTSGVHRDARAECRDARTISAPPRERGRRRGRQSIVIDDYSCRIAIHWIPYYRCLMAMIGADALDARATALHPPTQYPRFRTLRCRPSNPPSTTSRTVPDTRPQPTLPPHKWRDAGHHHPSRRRSDATARTGEHRTGARSRSEQPP